MRVDRHAAAVVADGEPAASFEEDFDDGGVAGHRLVHRVVDHFGEEVMQAVGVGAADVHAGAPAHRLEPLEHLDRSGVVFGLARRSHAPGGRAAFGRNGLAAQRARAAKKVVGHVLMGV